MSSDRVTRLHQAIGVAAAFAIIGCETPSVDAAAPPYDPTALTGGIIYHWPLGVSLAIHVLPAQGDDRLEASVRTGAGQWVEALGYREHSIRVVADPAMADIIVRDARVPSPVDTGCAGSGWADAAATAVFCPLGDTARTLELLGGTAPGRTKMLITVDVVESATALPPIVLHEIGHALGIGGHSSLATDAMFEIPAARSPSRRDALTLRYVLHRRPDLTL